MFINFADPAPMDKRDFSFGTRSERANFKLVMALVI